MWVFWASSGMFGNGDRWSREIGCVEGKWCEGINWLGTLEETLLGSKDANSRGDVRGDGALHELLILLLTIYAFASTCRPFY